ncbi:MAG: hypothetical protein ACK4FA_01720 [Candidatus Paceibacteria bacterium]
MKKLRAVLAVFSFYLLSFLGASAHVKWFVESEEVIEKYHGLFPFYTIESKEVWIWSILLVVWVLLFAFLDKLLGEPVKLKAFGEKHSGFINRVAQVMLGLFLVTVSFVWKIIIIPEIDVETVPMMILSIAQALVGAMFIFNFRPRLASILLLGFCLSVGFIAGWVAFLENVVLLSLGVYFLIRHSKPSDAMYKLKDYALPIARVGTGMSLIVLAFTEKLAYPELSLVFLAEHQWNFFAPIFPWFTNSLFVLSAGFVEIGFGILFIMGYLTRVTTIMIAAFFACSVTAMLIQTGKWEVEDLVVYAAAVLFIFFGAGLTSFTKKG